MPSVALNSAWMPPPARAVMGMLIACIIGAGGCGQPKGELFPPVEPRLVWPASPQQPRIRYVGQLAGSADLKPAVSFGQQIGHALFGRKPAHALLTPIAVTTDAQDRLFVADSNAQLVHVFDLKTRRYAQLKPAGTRKKPAPPLAQPVGLAFEPPGFTRSGRLLVADSVAGRLVVFDGREKYAGTMGEGLLGRPVGVAIQPGTGRIFIADAGQHQVIVLAPDGTLVQRVGRRGAGLGEFNYPTQLVFDRAGRLYVSDSLNFRIQQFSPDGQPLRAFGQKGDLPGYFGQPKGVATDADNHVYVVDAQFEAIQLFDDAGRLLLNFGREGRAPGEFWLPAGIHIDPANRIWVADSYNRRVQVFEYLPEGSK